MNNDKSANVLITGATGGLGLAMVKAFTTAGYNVLATGRSEKKGEKLAVYGALFKPADLTNPAVLDGLCENQTTIIHAAALSDSWGKPEEFHNINVMATQHLLQAAKRQGVKNFIFISSPSIYAAMKDQYRLTEEDTFAFSPLNEYAQTKLKAEQLVLKENCENFKTASLRPRAIVGPDDHVLLPKIMKMIDRGILPLLRGGKAVIELTDVRDVAQSALLAIQNINAISGECFNISGGKPVHIKDLALQLAKSTKRKIHFFPFPMVLAKYLAEKLEKKGADAGYNNEPKLTRYTLATLAYSQTFNMDKAHSKLGYRPSHDAVQTILDVAKKRYS